MRRTGVVRPTCSGAIIHRLGRCAPPPVVKRRGSPAGRTDKAGKRSSKREQKRRSSKQPSGHRFSTREHRFQHANHCPATGPPPPAKGCARPRKALQSRSPPGTAPNNRRKICRRMRRRGCAAGRAKTSRAALRPSHPARAGRPAPPAKTVGPHRDRRLDAPRVRPLHPPVAPPDACRWTVGPFWA